MEAVECGAASLAMITEYWGKHVPLEQMRIEVGVSRDGSSAKNLVLAGKRFGMEVHAYKKDVVGLKELPMPCIIHWNNVHFVVLEGFKGKYVVINDPEMGRRRLTEEEFSKCFSGVVITFKPEAGFTKRKKENRFVPLIKERLKDEKKSVIKLMLLGLLLIIPGILIPVFSQVFLDNILGAGEVSWFYQFVILFLLTVLFQLFLTAYRLRLLARLQIKLTLYSAKGYLKRMFRLPISFYAQRYAGDLARRVDSNNEVNTFITGELGRSVLNLFVAIFYLILLLIFNPLMTLVGIIGIGINGLIMKLASERLAETSIKNQQDKGRLDGVLIAGLSVSSTLKASGVENEYSARILSHDAKVMAVERRMSRLSQIVGSIPAIISDVTEVILLMMGAFYILSGRMTLGMLVSFTTLYSSFSDPVEELIQFAEKIQLQKANMERIDDVMKYPIAEQFEREGTGNASSKLSGHVALKGITFGYSSLADPLITDFSFDLAPGKSIAFVGPSGCGKSTVSKLLGGLYEPWEGEIYLDRTPRGELPKEMISASISTVNQNIAFFSGTIRDNITLWNPAILEKDIIAAAKDAMIHDIIMKKPGGYDYMLSEGAENLSGGEGQRLEIARALATNPTILIMDEATSALDPITEKQIIDNIKRRGCTSIIIAHRLSAVRNCDEIIVMYDGQIVERGTNDELAQIDGLYRQLMLGGAS